MKDYPNFRQNSSFSKPGYECYCNSLIPQSLSSLELINTTQSRSSSLKNTKNLTCSLSQSSNNNSEYFTINKKKLSSNLNIINYQVSNMKLNSCDSFTKNKSEQNKDTYNENFEMKDNIQYIKKRKMDYDDLCIENESLKKENQILNDKLKEQYSLLGHDELFELDDGYKLLKDKISKNEIKIKLIENELNHAVNENEQLKKMVVSLKQKSRCTFRNNIHNKPSDIYPFTTNTTNNTLNDDTNKMEEATTRNISTITENNINLSPCNKEINIIDNYPNYDNNNKNNNNHNQQNITLPLYLKKKIAKQSPNLVKRISFQNISGAISLKKQNIDINNRFFNANKSKNYNNENNNDDGIYLNYIKNVNVYPRPIIEKKVLLSPQKILCTSSNTERKVMTSTENSNSKNRCILIMQNLKKPIRNKEKIQDLSDNNTISEHNVDSEVTQQKSNLNNTIKNAPRMNIGNHMKFLFKLHSRKNKMISLFDIKKLKFISKEFKSNSNSNNRPSYSDSFYRNFNSSEATYFSIGNGFYVITGKKNNLFYYYDSISHSFIQLSSLKNSHIKSLMISYNEYIIAISGASTNSVEKYNIRENKWEDLPDLNCSHCESSCLILNKDKLYVYFGYDYLKQQYSESIEYINLSLPKKWNIVQISLRIKLHSVFTIGAKEESSVFLVGGLSNEGINSDLIEIKKIANNVFKVTRNTQKGNIKDNSNIIKLEGYKFREVFCDYIDINKYSWKKCGMDLHGNVHLIDIHTLKHKIYNINHNDVI